MEVYIVMRQDVRNNESHVLTVYKNYKNAEKAVENFNHIFNEETAYKYCWICHRTIADE